MKQSSSISYFLIFLGLISGLCLKAQYTLVYQPLRCVGEIPEEFKLLGSQKASKEIAEIDKKNLSKYEHELESKFAINSNFGVDAMLLSGKVLYGDPLTKYVNQVADKILIKDSSLRKELRFYVLKSGNVNAFATNQGVVFVTVGLLSHVKNEAQLAFILCHEIIHYVKKHNLEHYRKQKDLKKEKLWYGEYNFDQRLKMLYKHSRSSESEADKEGMKLFMKTKYKTSEAISSFDMLMVSHLPYQDMEWSMNQFQDSLYKFPKSYVPSKGNPIVVNDNEDDDESTHPNIRKRKDALEKSIDISGKKGDSLYLLGKNYFDYIQKQARIELCFVLINYAEYVKVYYLSYLYSKIYNDSNFSSRIAAYCIYAKSVQSYQSHGLFSNDDDSETEDEKTEEGLYYYTSYFFDHINRRELAVLSTRVAWNAYSKNRNDSFSKSVFIKSVKNLFENADYELSDFYMSDGFKSKDTVILKDTSVIIDENNLSKVERLRLKQKKEKEANKKDSIKTEIIPEGKIYTSYAFRNFFEDKFFLGTMKSIYDSTKKSAEIISKKTYELTGLYISQDKQGISGNTDSLLLINPSFQKIMFYGEEPRDYLYDEEQKIKLNSLYLEMAKKNDIYASSLNLMDRGILNTEKLNEYAIILEWITERMNNRSQELLMYNSQYISEIASKQGNGKVCFSGIVYTVDKADLKTVPLIISTILLPVLPIYLYYHFHGWHEITISFMVFDMRTGEITFKSFRTYDMVYKRKDFFNNNIYTLFNHLKRRSN